MKEKTQKLMRLGWMAPFMVASILLWLPFSSSALQTVRYVAPNGLCGGPSPCYAQVQVAIDQAAPGDEIRVAAGRYAQLVDRGGEMQIAYIDKSITLRGGYRTDDWLNPDPAANPTVLDAGGGGHVLHITGAISPTIEGLQLTNGHADRGGGVTIQTAAATLAHNQIYSNTATYGGGIYLKDSPAIIESNHIYSNTTDASGHGGGLNLSNSPARLVNNVIEDNRAHVGGGVEIQNYVAAGGATLLNNTVRNNVGLDYTPSGTTFDGAGGGINVGSGYEDRIEGNLIEGNDAKWGGGLHTFNAPVFLSGNTVQGNHAGRHGGGLYVQGNQPTIQFNRFYTNTADSWGGGVNMWVNVATLKGNAFQGNVAGWRGGGLYTRSAADIDDNLFIDNSAVEQGGGIFVYADSGATYRNNVLVGNQAAEGGGLYLWGTTSYFYHTTLSGNPSGDGRGVVIDKYPGLVSPGDPNQTPSTIELVNTIHTDHTVGIFATEANTVTVDAVLWHNTPTPIDAVGADLTLLNQNFGDPAFLADGYHLGENSAALDRGAVVPLDHDIDGQLRPVNLSYDLGADEVMLTAHIDPETGGGITYQDPAGDIRIEIQVPADAITAPVDLELAPFPPPAIGGLPFPNDWLFGPPFGLSLFQDGLLLPGITLTRTATVTLTYSEKMEKLHAGMKFLEMQLLNIINSGWPQPSENAACGPEGYDLDNNQMTVPLCDIGLPPPGSSGRTAIVPEAYASFYAFVAETEESRALFLPVVVR